MRQGPKSPHWSVGKALNGLPATAIRLCFDSGQDFFEIAALANAPPDSGEPQGQTVLDLLIVRDASFLLGAKRQPPDVGRLKSVIALRF